VPLARCLAPLVAVGRCLAPLIAAPLIAALACSDGRSPPGEGPTSDSFWEPVSGSRLEARFLIGADGSRIFHGWHDRARGEFCRIARGPSGRHFCFPSSNPAVYSDARCQQPAGQHLECAFRYTGVARGDRRCGNETLTLWQEGEPLNLPGRYPDTFVAFREE
jgi:hypothetical protein